jgi:hypothetical protein
MHPDEERAVHVAHGDKQETQLSPTTTWVPSEGQREQELLMRDRPAEQEKQEIPDE